MKYIKKVSVSPIPATSGAVIDSFNATDKTTNAPSIRAVEDKLSYSTEEKQIGYWIDGRPLYRKTYNAYRQDGSVYYIDETDFVTIADIKFTQGTARIRFSDANVTEAIFKVPISIGSSPLGSYNWVQNVFDKRIYIERTNSDTLYNVVGIEFTIFYTKTTD